MKLFILGGTTEARRLADQLVEQGHTVTLSLAGLTRKPRATRAMVRTTPLGGVEGLTEVLRSVDALIDATHPFAERISGNSHVAAANARCPRLVLQRPEWPIEPSWQVVDTLEHAAAALPPEGRVFLAVGRQGLSAFTSRPDPWYLVRVIDPPEEAVPLPNCHVIAGYPSNETESERALLQFHGIDTLITKNAGGDRSKLDAAQELGVRVIMVRRPTPPHPPRVSTVDAVLDWVASLHGTPSRARRSPGMETET